MAPAQIAIPSATPQPSDQVLLSKARVSRSGILEDEPIRTVDSLIRHRARTNPHDTIVSYPRSGIEFVDYSMQQLDVFAYRVAIHYQSFIPSRQSSAEKPTTVALLGPSNFDYLITMLALTKLGHTILFLSTRISIRAVESLIKTTGASYLLTDGRFTTLGGDVLANVPSLQLHTIAGRGMYDFPIEIHADTRMDYDLDTDVETNNHIYIIHSSGSTGLPKPIYQSHKSTLANYAISMEMKAFITLPLYHNHGICGFFRAVYCGRPIHIYNADLPLTQKFLTSILRKHDFEIFYGVPYALKLLAETSEGIDLLKKLRIVMYGGSACPDMLGETLVQNGVNLVGHYGATEVGQLMTSFRPLGDNAWNYVRETPKLSPYLRWVPRGPNLFECFVLPGWPSKVASNQEDGSYATKDLFEPHPTINKAWKYIARQDDTINLVNGEMFNPVMMEGRIRSHKAVVEAVISGAGHPYPVALIVPSASTQGMAKEQIVDELWSTIEECNKNVEAYARLGRDTICILDQGCPYPRTDKGTVIRQAFYRDFAEAIEKIYDEAEKAQSDLRILEIPELENFLRAALAKSLPQAATMDRMTDFFTLGLDSLQSLQVRSAIVKNIDIGNNILAQNVVFDFSSIDTLSRHLYNLRIGKKEHESSLHTRMRDLIDRYSQVPKKDVVLTGVTGSLGAHVLAQLIKQDGVGKVYCLVRAKDEVDALGRVQTSLSQRKINGSLSTLDMEKISALPSDLSKRNLGLDGRTFADIRQNLAVVIHCAWAVNFNWNLSSFENDCIAGVRNLIDLCLAVPSGKPASFNFCSSVSTVVRCPDLHTPEELAQLEWAQDMGYAQSKCVAEHITMNLAQKSGLDARILRVGQIVADTVHGVWSDTEAIPLILQSAMTIGALPKLQERPSWTPVDIVGKAVCEISLSNAGSLVANVTNAKTFSWANDLLPALRETGLKFDEVEPREWIERLSNSSDDAIANPPKKLMQFFRSKYDKVEFSPPRTYETKNATALSPSLANAPVLDAPFVKTFIDYFQSSRWQRC